MAKQTNIADELKEFNKEAKKQKTYKVLSLIGGAAISGYLGYKYINK